MALLCFGEILWDDFGDRRLLGGAPFNVAAHAHRLGLQVHFVSAVGDDAAGQQALAEVERLGLSTRHIKVVDVPTGRVAIELTDGQPDYTICRPAAYDHPSLTEADWRAIELAGVDWIYHGTLAQRSAAARALLAEARGRCPRVKVFYDLNLRRDNDDLELIASLLPGAEVLKLNADEVWALRSFTTDPSGRHAIAAGLASRFGLRKVCLTLGAEGSAVWSDGRWHEAAGYDIVAVDAVGAGDAWSAAMIQGLSAGDDLWLAQLRANRLGALIASKPGAIPAWTATELDALGADIA